jgi:hypothetical protein
MKWNPNSTTCALFGPLEVHGVVGQDMPRAFGDRFRVGFNIDHGAVAEKHYIARRVANEQAATALETIIDTA